MIELLVVIAILGILAALLLPVLSKAKAYAHTSTCKNHLHQMGLALQMYVDENQSKYPYYLSLPDPKFDSAVGADNTGFWWAKLLPYYPVKWLDPAYHCPGYRGAIRGRLRDQQGWRHPLGSYAYNARGVRATWSTNRIITNNTLLGLGARAYRTPLPGMMTGVISEGQIAAPSEMFSIGESRWKDQGDESAAGGDDFMLCGYIHVNRGWGAFDPARHGKHYNQLFCDGHVLAISPWVLFNPTKTAVMWNYDHQPHPEFWPPF